MWLPGLEAPAAAAAPIPNLLTADDTCALPGQSEEGGMVLDCVVKKPSKVEVVVQTVRCLDASMSNVGSLLVICKCTSWIVLSSACLHLVQVIVLTEGTGQR